MPRPCRGLPLTGRGWARCLLEALDFGGQLEQSRTRSRVQRLERVAHRVALDDATGGHDRLGCAQAALAVLEIDQGKNASVGSSCLLAPAGAMLLRK